jgi:NAD(P)-dependent dehydrogenase (short-subunit alcohol dehydrogenase family)
MKKVIITGANRGLGKATAKRFLNAGWHVFGTYRENSDMWDAEGLTWINLDLSIPASIEKAAQDFSAHAPFDVLINNSGVNDESEDHENASVNMTALRKTLEVNLIGTIDFTERMIANLGNGGHIVSIGSRWGMLSVPREAVAPSYSISKAGLAMYTQRLAARLTNNGITVSILTPGWVKTDMGGDEAPRTPEEAAEEIFALATSEVPTGKFWRRGKEEAW